MLEKFKNVKAKTLAYLNRQWWGMKVLYWFSISVVVIITIAFLMFRKPKVGKLKKSKV